MIKEMNKYKDLISESVKTGLREIYGTNWNFELDNIDFNIDYANYDDETDESTEIAIIYIKGRYGNNEEGSWKDITIALYNLEEFDLDNIQFLRGVFFGYFQGLEDAEERLRKEFKY